MSITDPAHAHGSTFSWHGKKRFLAACVISITALAALAACNKLGQVDASGAAVQATGTVAAFERTSDGVVVTLASGAARRLRLQVINDRIIRLTAIPHTDFSIVRDGLMVIAHSNNTPFEVEDRPEKIVVKAAQISAEIARNSGAVTFRDANGHELLAERDRGSFTDVMADPEGPQPYAHAIQQTFYSGNDEGFYGLGQHQDGHINIADQNVEMTTFNMVITVPYLLSTRNYGLLWNNSSVSRWGDPREPAPISRNLRLFDADGNPGGLTARYYQSDTLKLTRVEKDLDYQFLARGTERENPLPAEITDPNNMRVVWEGSIASDKSGLHKFRMYSSGYAKLYVDGKLVQDRWRMNWNPWYHNFNLAMKQGEKKAVRIEWIAQNGYFNLVHNDPLPETERDRMSLFSETGRAIDYYVVAGKNMDDLVAGYRTLTGKSVMLPRWSYGFWQSRERYKSQDELLAVVEEYRKRGIPFDNIVLDWSYWPENAWGSHDFDAGFFPDPGAMVKRVHELNAQIMISVWPKFYPTTEHYKALDAKGFMHTRNIAEGNLDWIGKGYPNGFYDPYPQEAREIFWQQIHDKIKVHGFDAWWLDAVEPDIHSNLSFEKRKWLMNPNAYGTGAELFNAYALPQAEGVFAGERKTHPDVRSFILTRSGFGGIQRAGAALWSGDIVSRWSDLKDQIAAGVGVSMAGVANWTFDIGGFTPENRFRSNRDGKFVGNWKALDADQRSEWQELNTRWFQFGAFVPLFRSHGQNPYREIFNLADDGSEVYKSLVDYTHLRYRLMPYIYTLAGNTYHKDDIIMRGLVMDFPQDEKARDLNDQYLFGPAFLVSPIYEYQARQRDVYLPAGTDWYNFHTGQRHTGGQTLRVDAPLSRSPLFVRAGAIVPTGPAIQYADQVLNAPLTLNVYTGADGEFEIYEDDGRSNGYERGEWSRIPVRYNERSGSLTLGARVGKFPGMAERRQISVRWISGPSADAANFDAEPAHRLIYTGSSLSIKR